MTFLYLSLYLSLSLLGYLPLVYELARGKPPEGFLLAGFLALLGFAWQAGITVLAVLLCFLYSLIHPL